jgi:hypothetical protein
LVRITLIVEGETEKAFFPHLRKFLKARLAGRMPNIDPNSHDGRIPKDDRLKRIVERKLNASKNPADAVIALTDVYTGNGDFSDAANAKAQMKKWVGKEPRFYPHAAQYDFEAWLLPYWERIRSLSGTSRSQIAGRPEQVNHGNPPAHRLKEIFHLGSKPGEYVKPRDADRILRDQDLMIAIQACPELKALVNTILKLCGAPTIA